MTQNRLKKLEAQLHQIIQQEIEREGVFLDTESVVGYAQRCLLGVVILKGLTQDEIWNKDLRDYSAKTWGIIKDRHKSAAEILGISISQAKDLESGFEGWDDDSYIVKESEVARLGDKMREIYV